MKDLLKELNKMKLGQIKDVVYSSGILRSSKQLEKVDNDLFYFHDTSHGWNTAELDTLQAVKFIKGETHISELNFI
jgi:pullulanase/glycogen debranching enzyme